MDLNPFKKDTLERIGKFYATSILVSVVTIILMMIFMVVFTSAGPLVLGVGALIISIASINSTLLIYEDWRGCNIQERGEQ